jgi:hypothetical protein
MTWREQMLVRILLIIAAMFADDPQTAESVKRLATTIQVDAPKERAKALAAAGLVD